MHVTAETGRLTGLDEAATPSGRVLVFAGHASTAQDLCGLIMRLGFDTSVTQSTDETFDELSRDRFDVCLIDDDQLPDVAADLTARLHESQLPTQLVRLTDLGGPESPLANLRLMDGVPQSSPVLLHAALSAAVERSKLLTENRRLRRQLSSRLLFELVGNSPEMHALREQVLAVAASSMPVLITGEPGSGTNLVAHGIHIAGRRSFRPFVRLDCRLLSAECLEEKLFAGSENGNEAPCRLDSQLADGGTLFLDNIDALPQPTQKKLAAALDTLRHDWNTPSREMYVVRIVVATHADLEANQDRFRGELYELLSASRIDTPALRVRKSDIAPLTEHFLNGLVAREGRAARRVTLEALRLLEDYNWPGNVRELQNVVERSCSLDFGSRLTAEMVRPWLAGDAADDTALPMTLKEMERKLIETTFARYEGNRERTAQALQIGLRTLSGKLRDYGYPPRGGPGSNHSGNN